MHTRRTAFFAGAAAGAVLTAIALGGRSVLADGSAQAAKYPIEVVLENNRVRVRDVTFPPGVTDTGLIVGLWFIYRVVRGWIRLNDRRPMYA